MPSESSPSLKQLRLEQLRRACRSDLLLFCRFVCPGYQTGKHLDLLTRALERVEAGEIQRLMVFMPPRHGKSTTISQLFPIWYFGRKPTREVIQTGYSDDIAAFHSKHARSFFASERFSSVFPGVARMADEAELARQSVQDWQTLHGGRYRAVGITSGLSGRGAHLIIIDDPIKNREEGNSSGVRAKILQEYRSTLYTRLSPGGAIVLVMTRWHPDDLAGTLLREMEAGGEQWTVLSMPAIDEQGQAMWPERWPLEKLQQIRTAIGSAEFGALYQQNPKLAQGSMFKREWFGTVSAAPADGLRVRYWDRAATHGGGDWTSGLKMFKSPQGIFYVEDVIRLQGSDLEVLSAIKNTAAQDGVNVLVRLEQDPGSSGKVEVNYLIRELCGYNAQAVRVDKAKELRAGPAAAQAEAGNIKLVRGRWNEAFLNEIELFPNGDFDDQTDSFSGAFNSLVLNVPIWVA